MAARSCRDEEAYFHRETAACRGGGCYRIELQGGSWFHAKRGGRPWFRTGQVWLGSCQCIASLRLADWIYQEGYCAHKSSLKSCGQGARFQDKDRQWSRIEKDIKYKKPQIGEEENAAHTLPKFLARPASCVQDQAVAWDAPDGKIHIKKEAITSKKADLGTQEEFQYATPSGYKVKFKISKPKRLQPIEYRTKSIKLQFAIKGHKSRSWVGKYIDFGGTWKWTGHASKGLYWDHALAQFAQRRLQFGKIRDFRQKWRKGLHAAESAAKHKNQKDAKRKKDEKSDYAHHWPTRLKLLHRNNPNHEKSQIAHENQNQGHLRRHIYRRAKFHNTTEKEIQLSKQLSQKLHRRRGEASGKSGPNEKLKTSDFDHKSAKISSIAYTRAGAQPSNPPKWTSGFRDENP